MHKTTRDEIEKQLQHTYEHAHVTSGRRPKKGRLLISFKDKKILRNFSNIFKNLLYKQS
jgi:hypothetical protein